MDDNFENGLMAPEIHDVLDPDNDYDDDDDGTINKGDCNLRRTRGFVIGNMHDDDNVHLDCKKMVNIVIIRLHFNLESFPPDIYCTVNNDFELSNQKLIT